MLCEASKEIEDLLKNNRSRGEPEAEPGTLDARDEFEHYVLRGNEEESVLIAARKDTATCLELLHWEIIKRPYTEKGKKKTSRTRIMIAKVTFKQNIGHMGKEIVVAGVHGHNRMMKYEFGQQAMGAFWESLAAKIRSHGVTMMAGDLNMSLTQVVVEMRKRGLVWD